MAAENKKMIERVIVALDKVDGLDVIVGMGPDSVYLADGRVVRAGDLIVSVDGTERTIEGVDYEKREAGLGEAVRADILAVYERDALAFAEHHRLDAAVLLVAESVLLIAAFDDVHLYQLPDLREQSAG